MEAIIFNLLRECEYRNKRQREALKKKYAILEKDELLEKINCLKQKLYYYEHPKEVEEYEKKTGKKIILSEVYKC